MVQQLIPARHHDAGTALTDEQLLSLYDPGASPLVRFNFVCSADGAATTSGRSGGLGTPADQRLFALMRRPADVILVGAGTIRAEGYAGELIDAGAQAWRRKRGMPAHPGIAVVSGSLELDPRSAFFAEAPVPVVVFTTAAADPGRRQALERVADVVTAGDEDVDPRQVIARLAERGHRMVHSEGGPSLFAAFQRADAVDSLCLSISPLLAGGAGMRIASGFTSDLQPVELSLLLEEEGALFTEYRRHRPGHAPGSA
ncbi:pyrimidine reductase family protein [Arthrobacter sp. JSM 101049]|uniref:pyrimidine reductase family protein n=1 Tax=Arthrobacter sp. JSM 101049 TaxID=929097 RepID=UPI00356AF676